MLKVIAGHKGSGKTARLVDSMNTHALQEDANMVCLERGGRLLHQVHHAIRLIDVSDYPVQGASQLIGFIAGIYSRDFDLSHLYIDSLTKVVGVRDPDELAGFLGNLAAFSEGRFDVTVTYSTDPDSLPEDIRRYC